MRTGEAFDDDKELGRLFSTLHDDVALEHREGVQQRTDVDDRSTPAPHSRQGTRQSYD